MGKGYRKFFVFCLNLPIMYFILHKRFWVGSNNFHLNLSRRKRSLVMRLFSPTCGVGTFYIVFCPFFSFYFSKGSCALKPPSHDFRALPFSSFPFRVILPYEL
uniref:Uncharacterized protein n=1 Tax=Cacopsylla melanoneura TaxID=428564 RepID=A0A8D8R8H6_9HEMI